MLVIWLMLFFYSKVCWTVWAAPTAAPLWCRAPSTRDTSPSGTSTTTSLTQHSVHRSSCSLPNLTREEWEKTISQLYAWGSPFKFSYFFFIILCLWLSLHNCSVKVYIYQNKGRAFLPRSLLKLLFIILLAFLQCTALHNMRRINLSDLTQVLWPGFSQQKTFQLSRITKNLKWIFSPYDCRWHMAQPASFLSC